MLSDKLTTIFGFTSGIGQLGEINWHKLIDADPTEVGRLVIALATMAWGYFTNKGGSK